MSATMILVLGILVLMAVVVLGLVAFFLWRRQGRGVVHYDDDSASYTSFTPSSIPGLRAVEAGPGALQTPPFAASFIVQNGTLQGSHFPLNRPTIVLGRSSQCDITLPDPRASRRHAQLQWQADGPYLIDLQSTNGTYVNEQRITRQRLEDGDEVMLGRTILRFSGGP